MKPHYTQSTDMLSSAPVGAPNPGGNMSTGNSSTPRYSSTEEMASEFGSYRVNDVTENLMSNRPMPSKKMPKAPKSTMC